ncbi:hypothetical protein WIW50_09805 [Flavobacteriaceae bacterium 3-367]|uniref:hypothetical protein n=1 Tax=Eudoraea algarum TaxID=3417568 RepID=UPI0032811A5F
MKYVYLILVITFFSCKPDKAFTETEQKEFEKMAQAYQSIYMEGGENLDEILAGIDKSIQMWENGKIWTYDDMVKFGPHLPKKTVIENYDEQKLLERDLGYDFVSILYINTKGDTLRETTSRIWKNSDKKWQIVYMSNLINKAD